jgi:hypothetical protein
MSIPVTVALTGFCGALLVGLAARVSMLRVQHKIPWGDGGNAEMMRAVRVHANTAEHAPIFILLALVYELTRGSTHFLVATAALFVVARIAFAIGILARGLHQARQAGALATYLTQAVLAVALLFAALGA